jgi:type VI protein secretion system component Hcp
MRSSCYVPFILSTYFCQLSGHESWIPCIEVIWEAERPIPTDTGKTVDRTGSLLQTKEVIIKKQMDSTSSRLFKLIGENEGKKIEIHFLLESGLGFISFSEWVLDNTFITGYSISASSEGIKDAIETLRFNFMAIEIKSFSYGDDSRFSSPFPVKFNRETDQFV